VAATTVEPEKEGGDAGAVVAPTTQPTVGRTAAGTAAQSSDFDFRQTGANKAGLSEGAKASKNAPASTPTSADKTYEGFKGFQSLLRADVEVKNAYFKYPIKDGLNSALVQYLGAGSSAAEFTRQDAIDFINAYNASFRGGKPKDADVQAFVSQHRGESGAAAMPVSNAPVSGTVAPTIATGLKTAPMPDAGAIASNNVHPSATVDSKAAVSDLLKDADVQSAISGRAADYASDNKSVTKEDAKAAIEKYFIEFNSDLTKQDIMDMLTIVKRVYLKDRDIQSELE
jgi:hypothetical protein